MPLRFHGLLTCFALLAFSIGCAEAGSSVDVDSVKRAQLTVRDTFSARGHTVRFDAAFVKLGPSCQETRIGECIHTTCADGAWSYADPGLVRVVSSAPAFAVEARPGALRGSGATEVDAFPAAGQTLTLSGSGAEVPAFEVTVEYPKPMFLESPQPDDTSGSSLPPPDELGLGARADSDLELALSNVSPTSRLVLVTGPGSSLDRSTLTCDFDASSGRVVVPSAVLGRVRGRTLELITAARATTRAGSWPIDVAAGTYVLVKTNYASHESVAAIRISVQ
jgi:hypothetical protein